MSNFYRRARSGVGTILRALRPRQIAWQLMYADGPATAITTKLGLDGRLDVRIRTCDVIGKAIYIDRVFEKPEVRLVTGFLKPGMTFFDVGANLGQYTLLAADKVGPDGHVHSFEPGPRIYEELSFNVALNRLQSRCTLNNVALSNRDGIARLSRYEVGSEGYSSLGKRPYPGNTITGFDEVVLTTIDSYVRQHSIKRVDLIKMDIEGAELFALQGAADLLSTAEAPPIVIEMADVTTQGFEYQALEIWDYLEQFGYQWFAFNRKAKLSRASRPHDFQRGKNLLAVKAHFERWNV